jgi:phosphoribosyl-dephospho-CoA transferase
MARQRPEVSLPRPHDLLRVESVAPLCRDAPAWVRAALRAAPWVVVRRDRCEPDRVPVGIRGAERCQRYGSEIGMAMIAETLSPPELLGRIDNLPDLPATQALHQAAQLLAPTMLLWGPGGSVGFTLASGVCAITPDSDLDLVFTAHRVPPRRTLAVVREALRTLPARVDVQLDLPVGGIAVDDLLGGADRVLVRTADGPVLTDVTALTR